MNPGSIVRALPPIVWRWVVPLLLPSLRKAGARTVEQILVIVLAEALKALRGTDAYHQVIQAAAGQIKALVPGGAIEPVIGDMLSDLGQALKG